MDKLKEKLLELSYLRGISAVLEWDMEVNMPIEAVEIRAKKLSYLSGLAHSKFTSKEFKRVLIEAKNSKKLSKEDSAIIRETERELKIQEKLPNEFVEEMSRVSAEAHHIWAEAKKKNKFKLFAPQLTKIVNLKRKQAKYLGYTHSPYDALLDLFEPGLDSLTALNIFESLKNDLVALLKRIKSSKVKPNDKKLLGKFPLQKQKEFNELVAKTLGFDFNRGRLDVSSHPFSTNFHPKDARITTRYKETDVLYSLGSTIHEVGHALYELGLPYEKFGTPMAEAISLGIHESQSRVWENMVGKSARFWKYFFPVLQKHFPEPFRRINFEDFYSALNKVEPSFIRTDADEVTYNLHVIIRFEIEKALIEGSIEIADLPQIWNQKYMEYLGVTVKSDTDGVLQDVHWSQGYFGYFPTYTLGNLYSAQFYNQAKKDIMNLEKLFERGKFLPFLEWLRKNIHRHGKFYSAADLCQQVTGEPLNPKYYSEYLENKFSKIYKLK